MHSRTLIVAVAAAATAAALGYALYFDYRRRNDHEFRRKLKRQQKKASKSKSVISTPPSVAISDEAILQALEKIKSETLPESVPAREQFFMTQLAVGEQLQLQGSDKFLDAAIALYKALRVYPVPMELLMIYESSLNPEVFGLIMKMTSLDVSAPLPSLGRAMSMFGSSVLEEEEGKLELKSSATSDVSFRDWEKLAESIEPL